MDDLASRIALLSGRLDRLERSGVCKLELVAPQVWILRPSTPASATQKGRDIPLTFLALTHGDETCGVDVLSEVLRLLDDATITLPFPIGVALGNAAAAEKGRRFLEQDLNRSFGTASHLTLEDRRAKEIEGLLSRTQHLVDFHQTITRSDFPFFIFGYAERAAALANLISPDMPLVTFWGGQFSKAGKTTIDYMREGGATALTLEMGHLGFDRYQREVGVLCAIRAIRSVQRVLEDGTLLALDRSALTNEIFTFADTIRVSEVEAALDPGWYNFKAVELNQRLGSSRGGPIFAPTSGWMLFPKYHAVAVKSSHSPREATGSAAELGRILRRAAATELPSDPR